MNKGHALARNPFGTKDEILEAHMPSRLQDRESMIERVMGCLAERGCELDEFFDRLCLDEGLTNAIVHGNHSDPEKEIVVRVYATPGRWGVEIRDEGSGFDWRARLQRLDAEMDPLSPTGRGIALMLGSGADVRFQEGGSSLLISRELPARRLQSKSAK